MMDTLESILHYHVLLFWYIGERNWTVQSTSSIVKPRKEADEYQPGDIVIAKFQGKPYRAVIVRVEADKEALAQDRLQFDRLLHDASLTPSQILVQMGIDVNLDEQKENSIEKTPATKNQGKKAPAKRPLGQQQKPKEKKVKPSSTVDNIKAQIKEQKIVSLESSKLMAAKILKSCKTDQELQPLHTSSAQVTPTSTSCSQSFVQSFPQQQPSVSSSPLPQMATQTQVVSHATNHTSTAATSLSSSSCMPQYSPAQTQQQITNNHVSFPQQNMLSPQYTPSQILPPTQNFFQQPDNLYDWDYNGSASEFIANSFTNNDCSRCMPLISALTQRISSLEEKVNTLAADKHTTTQLAPITPYKAQATKSTTQSYITPTTPSHICAPATLNNMPPATSSKAQSTPQSTPTTPSSRAATPTLSSTLSLSVADNHKESENDDGFTSINLLPGYGVQITLPQLDACLRKSKQSGTALARMLCNVYFDEKTLAESSVRGTKNKPARDSSIINAIINFVWVKRQCPEKEVVQEINQKCSDTRAALRISCRK